MNKVDLHKCMYDVNFYLKNNLIITITFVVLEKSGVCNWIESNENLWVNAHTV